MAITLAQIPLHQSLAPTLGSPIDVFGSHGNATPETRLPNSAEWLADLIHGFDH